MTKARHVVMATHLPLVGLYYTMAHPKAEPVVVARISRETNGSSRSHRADVTRLPSSWCASRLCAITI